MSFERVARVTRKTKIKLKSLILAQDERWRHAEHMQVERDKFGCSDTLELIQWRTGE